MKALLALVLAAGVAIGLGSFYWNAEQPVPAAVVTVERADVADVLVTNGRIEAGERFDVHAETSGRVLRVPIAVGDAVQLGAVLAAIDNQAARAELAQAQARLDAAQAELAVWDKGLTEAERADLRSRITALEVQRRAAVEDLDRVKRLIEKEAAPRIEAVELERTIADLDREAAGLRDKLAREQPPEGRTRLEAQAREAEAGVALARRRLGSAEVRSPVAGTVYALNVRPGDFVTPGSLIARIAGSESAQAVLFIDEPELGRVSLGARATLTADAYPGKSWTCAVERLPSEVVELETRRVGEVHCRVAGKAERLIPNLTVSARIPSASASGVASLPREAVQRSGDEQWVWTIDAGNRVHRTRVETGVRGDARIEIRSGVKPGDRVVLPPAEPLQEGQLIAPQE
jgi:HlyD family secretion protein